MSVSRRKFSPEFKEELAREVVESSKPIKDVAAAYGVGAETLRRWVVKYRESHESSSLDVADRARLKELERENQELRAETAFLKKASLDSNRECNTLFLGGVTWPRLVALDSRNQNVVRSGSSGNRAALSARSPARWECRQDRSSRSSSPTAESTMLSRMPARVL